MAESLMIESFIEAIKPDVKETDNTYSAEVAKVDKDGTVWVYVAGSDKETPTASISAEVKQGDSVRVEWRNNKLYLVGNTTNPSAGIEAVAEVDRKAGEARNTAISAQQTAESASRIAGNTNQYFWHTETGTDTGAHITEVPREEFLADPTNGGGNLLARSNGIAVREGLAELAVMSKDGFDAKTYDANDNEVIIAHLGYGPGYDSGGQVIDAPYYTLGTRASGSDIGNYSVVAGYGCTASGPWSYAEGFITEAAIGASHAEGEGTYASGYSHAEGYYCEATGPASHAQNNYTIASSANQTALGIFNEEDNADTYAVIVGNGTGVGANRSNALTVAWDGNVQIALDTTAQSGTDHDIYDALTALGWDSDVIV